MLMAPPEFDHWRNPPALVYIYDQVIMGYAHYFIARYLLQTWWPNSEHFDYMGWYAFAGTQFLMVFRLWAIKNWPHTTREYIEGGMDHHQATLTLVTKDYKNVGLFPVDVCRDKLRQLNPMHDQGVRLLRERRKFMGDIRMWRSSRRFFYEAGDFHLDMKCLAGKYTVDINMKEEKDLR